VWAFLQRRKWKERERERDENRELEIGGVSRWCAGERAREKDTKIVYGLFF
jgi:hypothetical protein